MKNGITAKGFATMRWLVLGVFIVCAALLVTQEEAISESVKPVTKEQTRPQSFADMAEILLPTVVNISSTQTVKDQPVPDIPQFPPGSPFEDFFKDFMDRYQNSPSAPRQRPSSLGSGFVIDEKNGYIVTNHHVIRDADEIKVILQDDKTLDAKLIGSDEKTDLAVLQVTTDVKMTAAKFGNSDVVRVGDWVLAIGNPFGLGGTVTAGIVSARQRDINAGPYDDFIQTDASINRGNSGGPMFNTHGEVIGVNTAIFSPSGGSVGIGFAVPSNLAQPVVDQLIKYGQTKRGWLGVRIQVVTDEIAESLSLEEPIGALVASVTPGGPADKAKIKPGDIITRFNGEKIEQMRQLPRIVAETEVDKKVPVVVWRNGKVVKVKVTLGQLEKAEKTGMVETAQAQSDDKPQNSEKITELGLAASNLNKALRNQYKIGKDINGVVITEVMPKGPAIDKGIRAGEVIVEFDQQEVKGVNDIKKRIKAAQKAKRGSVLLLISRDGDLRFTALKIQGK